MKPSSIISQHSVEESDAVIISAPYEKTASSRKGTLHGPQQIVECLNSQLEFYNRDFSCESIKNIVVSSLPVLSLAEKTPEQALAAIQESCAMVVESGKFPVLLGGEHSVSLGLLQALSKKYDPKEITVVQIDAHCDLRDNDGDYSDDPSRLAHSCVMRRAHELGYKLAQVGIRTYSIDEYNYFTQNKDTISVFEWGLEKVPEIAHIVDSIKTKYVYLTIDVDGFDPAYMPGTGTPVQGGLEWWYGVKLIKSLIQKRTLIGADVVEVSPMQDSVLTEYGASQLVYDIISHKFADLLKV